MNEKKKVFQFKMAMFWMYFAQAITYCLIISFLINTGYNATQRGLMFSIGAIMSIGAQFVIGYLCDKNKTIKKYCIYISILFVIISFVFYMNENNNYLYHLITGAVMVVFFRVSAGVYDSWVLEASEECKNKFGIIRAYGSIGWAIASLLVSSVVGRFGYKAIPIFFALSSAVLIAFNLNMEDAVKSQNDKVSLKDVKELISNKNYLLIIASLFCAYMVSLAAENIIVDKIVFVGGTDAQVSYYWTITAMIELPLFFFGNKLSEKTGSIPLYVFTIVAYGIRFVLYAMVGSVAGIIMVSSLQFCTFPLLQITTKQLIDNESTERLKSSSQQIAMGIYSGLSALIGPVVAGKLEDSYGVNIALYFIASFAIFALLFAGCYIARKRKEKLEG